MPSTQYLGVRAKIGWSGFRILCLVRMTCIPVVKYEFVFIIIFSIALEMKHRKEKKTACCFDRKAHLKVDLEGGGADIFHS